MEGCFVIGAALCTKEKAMKTNIARLCTIFGSIMLIIALLILSIEIYAFNRTFFAKEYEKIGTADNIGMSEQDLSAVTEKLLDYTQGTEPNLNMQVSIKGEMREVFGQREKDHMVDVRALYLGARDVRTVSLIGAALLFMASFMSSRKTTVPILCRSFLWVSGAFLVAVAAIGLYAAIDFSAFWTSFHHVFFTNDLWRLSPTHILIQMVPEQFFSDLVTKIILRFVSVFIELNLAAALGLYVYKKLQKKASSKHRGDKQ